MSSGNVTLHPFISGAAAILEACPERAQQVERETSLNISEIVRDSSTSVGMTRNGYSSIPGNNGTGLMKGIDETEVAAVLSQARHVPGGEIAK
jgi:hypothetical protein